MNSKTYNALQKASEEYAATGAILPDEAFREGAYWLDKQYEWKSIDKVEPPMNKSILIRYCCGNQVYKPSIGRFNKVNDKIYVLEIGLIHTVQCIKDNNYSIEWTNIPE